MKRKPKKGVSFAARAERILALPVAHRVSALGGYGPGGEVIYEAHPPGCPSVLVDSQGDATATFMSNGSVDFLVRVEQGMDIHVLDGSFDAVEKRETGVPSANVWLGVGRRSKRRVASLINPAANLGLPACRVRIIKLGDPDRAMWFCAEFELAGGLAVVTAVRYAMVTTKAGPALTRETYLRNTGRRRLAADLWTYFNQHGTQRFAYNKQLWYDSALPVTPWETVVAATVPYSRIVQIKRISSAGRAVRPVAATCDYATFVGDTSATALLPESVRRGRMLPGGAGAKLNRFTTATVAASQFAVELLPGRSVQVQQSLLYVAEPGLIQRFRKSSGCRTPTYEAMSRRFAAAAKELIRRSPGARDVAGLSAPTGRAGSAPFFYLDLPKQKAVSEYANSVWTAVKELYETCRAHGAKLAGGIELGTRDRAQDMWPKMKEDPGRVRRDLVYAFSFMYQTCPRPPRRRGRLTLPEKLHGMFPRQYPSRWDERTQEVPNDNRPYTDSPLWLVNALTMYIRETGDTAILAERVGTVRLTDPQRPEQSGIVGGDATYSLLEVVFEIFACFGRHVDDSPYGLPQILYGDWCDPIDMFGTSVVGDATTRGRGRGAQIRLSAHLFECLVQTIDLCQTPAVAGLARRLGLSAKLETLKELADRIRLNVVKFGWEDGPAGFAAGFVAVIHELKANGSRPDYRRGQTGYTLGSMKGRDFDGINRRELACQAYCLQMLTTQRDYLTPVPDGQRVVQKLLKTTDGLFFDPKLGLVMFTAAIANCPRSIELVGRMGLLPAGCAENGEYHHCQAFMHYYRLGLPGQADIVWRQFKPIMSAMRDEALAGPFETPCTSYTSARGDPHFAKGMYFGLSGSVDWIIEIFQRVAGVELSLHDPARPDVTVGANLPKGIRDELTFRRIIHYARPGGGYRQIPFELRIRREGSGGTVTATRIRVNGRPAEKADIADLKGVRRVKMELVRVYGRREDRRGRA